MLYLKEKSMSHMFRKYIPIYSACLALVGMSVFYTVLLMALARYIFGFEGRPPLVFVGGLFFVILSVGFYYQFSILCKAWSQGK